MPNTPSVKNHNKLDGILCKTNLIKIEMYVTQ